MPTRAQQIATQPRLRPFLKWAGGKRQLLPQLRRFVPATFSHYYEPFFGSGALFFDLYERGHLGSRRARLIDNNRDLIGCYKAVAYDVERVVEHLRVLAAGHAQSGDRHYYRVRDGIFNPIRRELGEALGGEQYPADVAAMFIYLNRTGFNGLFRLNSRADFNVPVGRYANPRICDEATLRAASEALRGPGVDVTHGSFQSVLTGAQEGDFVYFDPPYAPLSTTARFTSYTPGGFSDEDQRQLRDVVLQLVSRGCHVVLSNSTATSISDLYEYDARAQRFGLLSHRVPARRAINSDATRRGEVMELIVSNVAPSAAR